MGHRVNTYMGKPLFSKQEIIADGNTGWRCLSGSIVVTHYGSKKNYWSMIAPNRYVLSKSVNEAI